MKHKTANDGQDIGFLQQELPYTVQEHISTKYEFHLDQDILEPCYYRNLITVLHNATEDDVVVLNINSQGGMLDSAISIMDALNNTRATTIAITTGSCYSAATLIALSCSNVEVGEFSNWMLHDGSYGVVSKSTDIVNRASFENRFIRKLFSRVYIPFISESELEDVMRGLDLWLTAEEVKERLANMYEILQQEAEEFIAEMEALQKEQEEPLDGVSTKPKKKKILPS